MDKRISELDALPEGSLIEGDLIEVVRDGENYKYDASGILAVEYVALIGGETTTSFSSNGVSGSCQILCAKSGNVYHVDVSIYEMTGTSSATDTIICNIDVSLVLNMVSRQGASPLATTTAYCVFSSNSLTLVAPAGTNFSTNPVFDFSTTFIAS